jgi:hypothetical protein
VKECDGGSGLSGGVVRSARGDGRPFLIVSFGAIIGMDSKAGEVAQAQGIGWLF